MGRRSQALAVKKASFLPKIKAQARSLSFFIVA
jgi:hypothetical protein